MVFSRLVQEIKDDFRWIRIIDYVARKHRYLYFEDSIQGALDLALPHKPVFEYINAMLAGSLQYLPAKPARILMGGLGSGSLVHGLRVARPDATIAVVEVDNLVVDLARNFFLLPDEVVPHLADFRPFVAALPSASQDLVLVDCYSSLSMPLPMMTREFYVQLRRVLSEGGSCILNLWDPSCNNLCGYQLLTILDVFAELGIYQCKQDHNLIVFAHSQKGGKPRNTLDLRGELRPVAVLHRNDPSSWPFFMNEAGVLDDGNLSAVLARFGLC